MDLTILYIVLVIIGAYLAYMFVAQPSSAIRVGSAVFSVLVALLKGLFFIISGIIGFIFGIFKRKR